MATSTATVSFNRDALLGVAFALLAAVGFSGKAILVKLAYLYHVDAITLLALRMVFAVPFFIGVAVWSKLRHVTPLNRHDWLLVLGLGLIGYYLSSLLDFLGLQYITAWLQYTSDPSKLTRDAIGPWVIAFLVVFTLLAYALKRAYWRDVH